MVGFARSIFPVKLRSDALGGWLTLLALACTKEVARAPAIGDSGATTSVDDSDPPDSGDPPPPTDDVDGDGTPDSGDCAPSDATIGPNLPEIEGDGIDQNCDGLDRFVTDIRPHATQFWGESDLAGFGEDMAIATVGASQVALIGQSLADTAGHIHVIGHPEDAMRRVMVQDGSHPDDDHLGSFMIGAEVDGRPALVAPYHLDNFDSFLAAWLLDGPPGDLGEGDLLFNVKLTTETRAIAGPPFFGPDLTNDGAPDLAWIETGSTETFFHVWPGPSTTDGLSSPPVIIPLPFGAVDAYVVRPTRSAGPLPDFAMFTRDRGLDRYVYFSESGEDGGRIDLSSPTTRTALNGVRADMNGDGVLERCVSSGFWVDAANELGVVACFPPATGGTLTPYDADTLLLGEVYGPSFGCDLAAGDLDGDGRDELIVGAPTILMGGRAGLIYILKLVDGALTIHATLSDFAVEALFGRRLGVGDLDGDGLLDIVAPSYNACFGGASRADPDASCPGAVWVIPGAAGLW